MLAATLTAAGGAVAFLVKLEVTFLVVLLVLFLAALTLDATLWLSGGATTGLA